MEQFFPHWKSSMYELVIRLSGAATKDPEVGSVLLESSTGKIEPTNDQKKFRNVETGKFATKKCEHATFSKILCDHWVPRRLSAAE